MTYLKPPSFVSRVANPLAMRFGGNRIATLTVAGRRTGKPTRVPVIPIDLDGVRYLVSARGEAEWVRNLRRAGRGALTRQRRSELFVAEEIPTADRGPVLAAYQKKAGWSVADLFRRLPEPRDHPVFKISELPADD